MSNVIRELNQAQMAEAAEKEIRDRQLDQRLATLAGLGEATIEPITVQEQVDVQRNPAHMAAAKKVSPVGVLKTARDAVIKATSTPPAHRTR